MSRVCAAARAVVPAAVAAAVLLPDLLGWDRVLPFAVFMAFRPVLLVVAVVGVAGVLLWRRRRTARAGLIGVTAVIVVAAILVVPRAVPDAAPPSGGTPLRVLTLNAYDGAADVPALAAAVAHTRPDLVVIPEAGERFRTALAPRLPDYRSWTNAAPGARDVRGIVVLASPRAGAVTARRLDEGSRYPWAELTGGILGPTRLAAVHVVSPVPRWVSIWPRELAMLQRWCAPGGGPAIVVGDLNATPDHSGFRMGMAGCVDAAMATGAGLTGTWHTRWPRWAGAQIDHVLVTGGPHADDVEVLDVPGTDHRALLVDLRLDPGRSSFRASAAVSSPRARPVRGAGRARSPRPAGRARHLAPR